MNKAFLSTMVFLAGSYALAADPAPAPTVVGTWNLVSAECTSGTPLSGGIKIGQDVMTATFAEDQSAHFNAKIAGCDMVARGTYKVEGSILTATMSEAQSCKDATPLPVNETKKFFIAYLNEQEAVIVTTGPDAAAMCPAGDSMVSHYSKIAPLP